MGELGDYQKRIEDAGREFRRLRRQNSDTLLLLQEIKDSDITIDITLFSKETALWSVLFDTGLQCIGNYEFVAWNLGRGYVSSFT